MKDGITWNSINNISDFVISIWLFCEIVNYLLIPSESDMIYGTWLTTLMPKIDNLTHLAA